jgi:hypothetical protein
MSDLLKSLKEALVSQRITAETTVGGHTWSFRSLNEGEELWRDKFINLEYGTNNLALITTERISTLAIGISAIDGKLVEEVFEISMHFTPEQKEYAAAEAMLDLLKEADREVVTQLRNEYISLILEKQEELKKNLPNSTPSLEKPIMSSMPDNMLSPEKESLRPHRKQKV